MMALVVDSLHSSLLTGRNTCCCVPALVSADVTEHGCLTTVSASGAADVEDHSHDHDAGHMVTSVSELDEETAARVVAELAANGRA
jgi:hypothetical protein